MASRKTKPALPKIPRAPAELAELWHSLAEGQLASYRRLHNICDAMLADYEAQVKESGDRAVLVGPTDIRNVAATLEVAVKGERDAAMMQFRDMNVALGITRQLGFIVQDPRTGQVSIDPEVALT